MKTAPGTEDSPLVEEIGRLVHTLDAAGGAVLPGSADALLRAIVEAAARIFGAGAASILLVDEPAGMLVFKVAYGAANRDLVGMRIPLDQGIAGYVAMTGQPIAISNVEQDARFNRDFAKSTGYLPRSILATPLAAGGRVIGVMEVLDKLNAPSFGLQDMELLALFAQQAALAIDMAQGIEQLDQALLAGLRQLARADGGTPSERLLAALGPGGDLSAYDDLKSLAGLLYEFGGLGEGERKTALKVLSAFAEYGRERRRFGRGAMRR